MRRYLTPLTWTRAHRAPPLVTACLLSLGLALGGCSRDLVVAQGPGDDVGYDENTDVVIVVGGSTWVVSGDGGGCVELEGVPGCVNLDDLKAERCGSRDAQADIIVVEGKVVDVICYPPKSSGVPIETVAVEGNGTTEVPQNKGHVVVTFAPETDGKVIEGDVKLTGEGLSLIGNGIDKTIIGGNLHLDSNNARVRGLTVNGNVEFKKNSNGSALSFCKIKGNLHIDANNVTVANCLVFGNVQVSGNGVVLVNVGVRGNFDVPTAEVCSGNFAFEDKDGDFVLDSGERGADLTCKK